jgi:hypothetical protein
LYGPCIHSLMRIEDLGKVAPRRGEPTSSFGVI